MEYCYLETASLGKNCCIRVYKTAALGLVNATVFSSNEAVSKWSLKTAALAQKTVALELMQREQMKRSKTVALALMKRF